MRWVVEFVKNELDDFVCRGECRRCGEETHEARQVGKMVSRDPLYAWGKATDVAGTHSPQRWSIAAVSEVEGGASDVVAGSEQRCAEAER